MELIPSFEAFEAGHKAGKNQVVFTRLAADLDTPVSLMLKLGGAARDTFMLESVTGGEVRGRYSIIGMKPDLIWDCRGTTSRINRKARFDGDAFEVLQGDPAGDPALGSCRKPDRTARRSARLGGRAFRLSRL